MSRVLALVSLVVCSSLALSCVRIPGGVAPSNIPVAPGGYVVLGPVAASDCSVSLLCILPVSGGNHVADAMKGALGQRPGTDAVVNISVDRVSKFFLLWCQTCTEVRATAVSLR